MTLISGTHRDFGLKAFPGLHPEIIFRANKPAVTQSGAILSTKDIRVTPDANGDWSVNLAATDTLATGGVWYTMEITWLDEHNETSAWDFPDWKLFVPAKGGTLADLLEKPANPGLIYVSLTGPEHPTNGTWWLNQNLEGTAGTGDLYEWSN